MHVDHSTLAAMYNKCIEASNDAKNIIRCVECVFQISGKVSFKALVLTFLESKRKEITKKKFNEVECFGAVKDTLIIIIILIKNATDH
jgi:hypothetical protein